MHQPKNSYLATKVLTASPEQLRLMLFDGAIQFSHKAARAMEVKDLEGSYDTLSQAKKIVIELITSLNPEVNNEICQKMSAVYTYIYKLMVDASFEKDVQKLKEAIQILEYERETWQLLIDKVNKEQVDTDAAGSSAEVTPTSAKPAVNAANSPAANNAMGAKWVPGQITKSFPGQDSGKPSSGLPTGRLSISG